MLGDAAEAWQFTAVFLFSGASGFVSLLFLRRIPDVAVSEEQGGGTGPIPWGAMASHPPFRRLLEMNAAWSIAYGGLTTFIVSYLKSSAGFGERRILLVMSLSFVGGLASYWVAGQRVDRLGSKPVLGFTMAAGALGTLGWGLVAGGLLPATTGSTLGLAFLMGLCAALFSVANNRLAMSIVPVMGRNHFFALFAVVWQLTLGVSPILWGILLDAVGRHRSTALGLEWNRFSLFFLLATAAFGFAFLMTRRLDEPRAAGAHAMLHELLVQHPQKLLVRLFGR
jgi:MFS family permease